MVVQQQQCAAVCSVQLLSEGCGAYDAALASDDPCSCAGVGRQLGGRLHEGGAHRRHCPVALAQQPAVYSSFNRSLCRARSSSGG
jgi:hypothetical protein